ncbi:MAG: hypothetical protein GX561_06115 [Lentisphaerae bacterium]|nr:hypothetical protein [Lentisphaerota bacterium]
MRIKFYFWAGLQSALQGRDIPAQGNALGWWIATPDKALKGRDIAILSNQRPGTGVGYDGRYIWY